MQILVDQKTCAVALIFWIATAETWALAAGNKRAREWKNKTTDQKSPSGDNQHVGGQDKKNCIGENCLLAKDALINARIATIKEDLLQKLHLTSAPNVSKVDASKMASNLKHMVRNLYGVQDGTYIDFDDNLTYANNDISHESEINEAQTERVYAFASKVPSSLSATESQQRVYFRFSPNTMNNKVDSAVIYFYLKQPLIAVSEIVTHVNVQLFSVDDYRGSRTEVQEKSFKKGFRYHGHWAQLDVTGLVDKWFKKPDTNFGMELEAMHDNENLVAFPQDRDHDSSKYTMYLEINTSLPKKRSRRDAPNLDCDEKDNETRCCRYPLIVDFESFQWDWIIAPKKYKANYCSGTCPFRHLQRNLHTHVVQQAHEFAAQKTNHKGNFGPCCYPTDLSPILMVYFNENKEVLVSKVPGMIVNRCGCA